MHLCMMYISMILNPDTCIYDAYICSSILDYDACVHDAHIHDPGPDTCMCDAYIYVPQSLTMMHVCMMHISISI